MLDSTVSIIKSIISTKPYRPVTNALGTSTFKIIVSFVIEYCITVYDDNVCKIYFLWFLLWNRCFLTQHEKYSCQSALWDVVYWKLSIGICIYIQTVACLMNQRINNNILHILHGYTISNEIHIPVLFSRFSCTTNAFWYFLRLQNCLLMFVKIV